MDYNYDDWNDDDFIPYELVEPGFDSLGGDYESAFGFEKMSTGDSSLDNCDGNPDPVGDPAIAPDSSAQNYENVSTVEESPAVPFFVPVPSQMDQTSFSTCFETTCELGNGGKMEWPLYPDYQIECPPPPPQVFIENPSEMVPFSNLEFKRKHDDICARDEYGDGEFFGYDVSLSTYVDAHSSDENVDSRTESSACNSCEECKGQVSARQVQFENYCNKKSICMSNVAKFSKPAPCKSVEGAEFDQEEESSKKKRTQTISQIFERRKQTLWKMSDSIDMITGGKCEIFLVEKNGTVHEHFSKGFKSILNDSKIKSAIESTLNTKI